KTQAVRQMMISDSRSSQAVRPPFLTFDALGLADGEAVVIVENRDVVAGLREAVENHPGVTLRQGVRVSGYSQHKGGVEVAIEGAGGGEGAETLRARLLVAADGAKSRLREAAGIKCVEWEYGQWGIVATIGLARGHDATALQHFMPPGPFAMLPLPGNRASLVWTEKEASARALLALGEDEFVAEIEQRLGRRFGAVSLAGPRGGFPLGLRIARALVAPRLALIGDAAHRLHPLAGQGVNLGFRDGAALAETLLGAARLGLDIGSPAVLEDYQRWRRFDTLAMAAATDGLNRLFSNDLDAIRLVRDIGLGLVNRWSGLKDLLIREAAGDTGTLPRLLRGEPL
ncbi:MAG TPA: FAD-dependent monooxygenase, partial [Hyphomicrobiales bacterium]|nr:FAD-dependent monooxygenase [Hyphomicrobiales bacterium]